MAAAKADRSQSAANVLARAKSQLESGKTIEAEATALKAVNKAWSLGAFGVLASAAGVLHDTRKAKRQEAIATGTIHLIDSELPEETDLTAGVYLIAPPRVGADARMLRESLSRLGLPGLVVTREPTTRDELWPVVTIGPITIRTRVEAPGETDERGVPPIDWFLEAIELLAGTALLDLNPKEPASEQIEDLLDRMMSLPDSDLLHETLVELAQQAERETTDPAQN